MASFLDKFRGKSKDIKDNVNIENFDNSSFANSIIVDSTSAQKRVEPSLENSKSSFLNQDKKQSSASNNEDGNLKLFLFGNNKEHILRRRIIVSIFIYLIFITILTTLSLTISNNLSNEYNLIQDSRLETARIGQDVIKNASNEDFFNNLEKNFKSLDNLIHDFLESDINLRALLIPSYIHRESRELIRNLFDENTKNINATLELKSVYLAFSDTVFFENFVNSLNDSVLNIIEHRFLYEIGSDNLLLFNNILLLNEKLKTFFSNLHTSSDITAESIFKMSEDLSSLDVILQKLIAVDVSSELLSTIQDELDILSNYHKDLILIKTVADEFVDNIDDLLLISKVKVEILNNNYKLQDEFNKLLKFKSSELSTLFASQFYIAPLGILGLLFFITSLFKLQTLSSNLREANLERLQQQTYDREQQQRRINEANQTAILRLMNELHAVAEGDLTQQTSVTEDITGAIADSINYTIEELRSLVANVKNVATNVLGTSHSVDETSALMLQSSLMQLREIRKIGQIILEMADRINLSSKQAQSSMVVANQSLQVSSQGQEAVQNTISSMNLIREQIQETSKRIKRLGESSQEIGEITGLIADITEQTNVLALNAAIQAASAGEAGRGFSVVAEEVQRLAERSADATRQITNIVKTIQTDAQGAIVAMEKSTQNVVEGAKLSDKAGEALGEIDGVTNHLANLIEQIATTTQKEAANATQIASNIQNIFEVTEKSGQNIRETAGQVQELSYIAQELGNSVERFKVS